MNRLVLLLGAAGLLLAAGCRTDDEVVCAPAAGPAALAEFSRRNMPAEQVFNLPDVGQLQTVRTAGGATLTIPANSLLVASTGAVATGAAQLRFREIYEVPDMILADLPTQTRGVLNGPLPSAQPLQSGGEFQIQLWQGRRRLVSNNGPATGPAQVPGRIVLTSIRPARANQGVQARWWTQPLLPPPTAPSVTDTAGWRSDGSVRVDTIPGVGGANATYRAGFLLDSLSWHNVDWLWPDSLNLPVAAVRVIVPGSADQGASVYATRVYLFPARNNVLLRVGLGAGLADWQLGNLPATLTYTAVVLQATPAGQLRFATQRFTLAPTGTTLTITPTERSEADIVRLIRQL